jgi:MoaA/NifB/PqqE/SkfB family radical SAM enzyme
MSKLVKAEILWTRKCPLRCSFCNMPNDTERAPVELMIKGLRNLKDLGCGFAAIYGASPLYDFEGLPNYVKAAEDMGILTTVIVDGAGGDKDKEKIQQLYDVGLRSLTVSFDFASYDKYSFLKSNFGMELMDWFHGLKDIRDVEIVATVTKNNYTDIGVNLYKLLDRYKKLWFSFDFLHLDRGHPGTKCKGKSSDLLLEEDHIEYFLHTLRDEKFNGYNIHQSYEYLEKDPKFITEHQWKCAPDEVFPSWLTIDADGTVLPCDDFGTDRSWKIWDFDISDYDDFTEFYAKEVEEKCKGCAWATHWDAHRIKREGEGFKNYVHK